ncbi:MAG: hypothetical protein EHM36_09320, partial [Deltaproteobacteria bacterium]
MERETKEHLEQRLLGMATKDDIEKLRQETRSSFRQLQLIEKEEGQKRHSRWGQEMAEIKVELEDIKRGGRVDLDPFQAEVRREFQILREETKGVFDRWKEELTAELGQLRAGGKVDMAPFQEEVRREFQILKEGTKGVLDRWTGELTTELGHLKNGGKLDMAPFQDEVRKEIQHLQKDTREAL